VQVAGAVAHHLRDRGQVGAAVSVALSQTRFPRDTYWQPVSLAQGETGIALICGYLDSCFGGEGWDVAAHQYLQVAAADAQRRGSFGPGLFDGLAGLGFATWFLSRGGTRYGRLLAAIDDALLPHVSAQADRVSRLREGASVGEFDVVSGLTGLGAYLLCRPESADATAALDRVLEALVELVRPVAGAPAWWTPAALMGNADMAAQFPHGNLNCGMAHGIPGPLALMALALAGDRAAPGLAEAVARVATWLGEHRFDDAWGPNWPVAVALAADGREAVAPACHPARAAWCYGAPGVARSLWLAGRALDRPQWRDLAVEAMRAVYRRPVAARQIDSPTLCHGVAGLLQITARFFNDSGLEVFAAAARALTDQLLELYEPDSLLGFRSLEPEGVEVDQPGLLDGAPGVALALLGAATGVAPSWDRIFLLA
jgi:hypothetical protein